MTILVPFTVEALDASLEKAVSSLNGCYEGPAKLLPRWNVFLQALQKVFPQGKNRCNASVQVTSVFPSELLVKLRLVLISEARFQFFAPQLEEESAGITFQGQYLQWIVQKPLLQLSLNYHTFAGR